MLAKPVNKLVSFKKSVKVVNCKKINAFIFTLKININPFNSWVVMGHGLEYESADWISKLSWYMMHFPLFSVSGILKWER